MNTDSLTYSTF